jgi:hypothetical protein
MRKGNWKQKRKRKRRSQKEGLDLEHSIGPNTNRSLDISNKAIKVIKVINRRELMGKLNNLFRALRRDSVDRNQKLVQIVDCTAIFSGIVRTDQCHRQLWERPHHRHHLKSN